jgi:two-component system, NarL family, nitrate/nitrite response regulator NarL
LKLSEKFRRFVILVSIRPGWIHLSTLSKFAGPLQLDEIMAIGAAGIILKTTPARSLGNAIRFMHAGEYYMPIELIRDRTQVNNMSSKGKLSGRELSVLSYLAEGRQNKDIAGQLQLAEPTIKMHVTSICKKLGAQNRTQAVIAARNLGMI